MTSTAAAPTSATAPHNSSSRSPQQQQRRMAPIVDSCLSMEEEWEQQQHIEQQRNESCTNSAQPPNPVAQFEDENDTSLFRGSRYDYRRDDSAVRDVVCASTAIMGENILDSPVSARMSYPAGESSSRSSMFQLRGRSSLGTPRTSTNASISVSDFPAPPSLYNSEENGNHASSTSRSSRALSVGIMAQGLAWARRQRDRRKQLYLQWQAEQQLDKIKMAHEEQQQQTTTMTMIDESRLDNGMFQNLGLSRSSSSGEAAGDFVVVDHHPNHPSSAAFEISKKISKSGGGYSVELPGGLVLNDDDPQQQQQQQDPDDASWIPPVRIEEEPPETMASCPYILNAHERQQIAVHVLPAGISSYCKWKRYYSLARDGDSFDNCLRNLQHIKPTLLVVRTARNAVFGGLADEAWEPHSAAGACFYGGSAACLFKIVPFESRDASDDDDERDSTTTRVQYYRWSGANRYVQLCDVSNKMLAFGGGGKDGYFGLCVEQDFQVGSTGPCATFDNEPLCDQENFDICDMEIYGFLQGQF